MILQGNQIHGKSSILSGSHIEALELQIGFLTGCQCVPFKSYLGLRK
jgi:hypothetical protein